jgi:serine protease
VCRFYGTPGIGPNSHFYTVDAAECEAVKHDPGWTYEGTAFFIAAPVDGGCASGTTPVYRAYNARFAQNDSNNRFATDVAVYNAMVAQGWSGEGIVFCAP